VGVTVRQAAERPVTRPWDPPGLPPRKTRERCRNHRNQCQYRDDDPTRCQWCHRSHDRPSLGCRDAPPHGDGHPAYPPGMTR